MAFLTAPAEALLLKLAWPGGRAGTLQVMEQVLTHIFSSEGILWSALGNLPSAISMSFTGDHGTLVFCRK